MSKNKVNPGKGYRLLKKGKNPEKVIRGDEYLGCKNLWESSICYFLGIQNTEFLYRRKIESPKGWNVTIHCKTRANARYLKACIVNHKVKITKAND